MTIVVNIALPASKYFYANCTNVNRMNRRGMMKRELCGFGTLAINKPELTKQWTVDKLSRFPNSSIDRKKVRQPKSIFGFPEALTNWFKPKPFWTVVVANETFLKLYWNLWDDKVISLSYSLKITCRGTCLMNHVIILCLVILVLCMDKEGTMTWRNLQ